MSSWVSVAVSSQAGLPLPALLESLRFILQGCACEFFQVTVSSEALLLYNPPLFPAVGLVSLLPPTWRLSCGHVCGRLAPCLAPVSGMSEWTGEKEEQALCLLHSVPLVTPCVSFSYQIVLRFSVLQLVSYNLISFWPFLPGDSIRSHRFKSQPHQIAPLPMLTTNPGYYCGSDLLGANSEIPTSFYSGSMYLPELLTELRTTFYLANYQLLQRTFLRESQREMHREGMWEEGWSSMPFLGAPLLRSSHVHIKSWLLWF